MGKNLKKLLYVAIALLVVGIVFFVISASLVGWDFSKFGGRRYETNSYEITEEFTNISVKTGTSDIVFSPSQDGKTKVVCYEDTKMKHSVNIIDGTLTVVETDTRKWYEYISWGANTKITVYLPQNEYSNLYIKNSTGDILVPSEFSFESVNITVSTGDVNFKGSANSDVKIKSSTGDIAFGNGETIEKAKGVKLYASTGDISAKNLSIENLEIVVTTGRVTVEKVDCLGDVKIEVSTGKTTMTDITCKNFFSDGDTGRITLKSVIAEGKFDIERDTGDVIFENSDAKDIFVETDTGDVEGSLLSSKVFVVETDTGRKRVPQTTSGGVCKISTDTGDIIITINDKLVKQ